MRVDSEVSALAARQHGAVTTAQLAEAGLSEAAIGHRVERGQLTRVHRGVYRVGPVPDTLTSPMAAVLACGPTAVLSHQAAAVLFGARAATGGSIDVTVDGHGRSRDGIRVHRAKLAPEERTERLAIPVTTPARTILDLAGALAEEDLERTLNELFVQRLVKAKDVNDLLTRHPNRRGTAVLRGLLDDPKLTRSDAERLLLRLVRSAQLPIPQTNVRVGRFEVDAYWPLERLVVEMDGFGAHGTRRAFERDRARDADLIVLGLRVLRVTWRQLVHEPQAVVARIAGALAVARVA
jgi:very-short-patch-repair endonuclease